MEVITSRSADWLKKKKKKVMYVEPKKEMLLEINLSQKPASTLSRYRKVACTQVKMCFICKFEFSQILN